MNKAIMITEEVSVIFLITICQNVFVHSGGIIIEKNYSIPGISRI